MESFKKSVFIGTVDNSSLFITVEFSDGRLSISGPTGQTIMQFKEYDHRGDSTLADIEPAPGWDVDKIKRLFDVWDRWHLNDMKAGSSVQEIWLRRNPLQPEEYVYPKSHYEAASAKLTAAGLNPDQDGYKYGSAWKREEVPADVLEFLQGLPAPTKAPTDEGVYAFIKANKITATAAQVGVNPNMDDSDSMDNWRVILRRPGAKMTVYFSKGVGHEGAEPTAAEVLDCMALDAAGVENAQSFDDWCGEYGYDTDSRNAHKMYTVCKRQAERLKKFLGDDAYKTLLWDMERL